MPRPLDQRGVGEVRCDEEATQLEGPIESPSETSADHEFRTVFTKHERQAVSCRFTPNASVPKQHLLRATSPQQPVLARAHHGADALKLAPKVTAFLRERESDDDHDR